MTEPRLLILDEPTRGIDIGAKAQIQKLVVDLAADGMAVLFISAELEEVLRLSDRVAVLRDRHKVAELPRADASMEQVMELIASGEVSPMPPEVDGRRRATALEPVLAGGRAGRPAGVRRRSRCRASSSLRIQDGHLYGSLVDILKNGAPTALIALGHDAGDRHPRHRPVGRRHRRHLRRGGLRLDRRGARSDRGQRRGRRACCSRSGLASCSGCGTGSWSPCWASSPSSPRSC